MNMLLPSEFSSIQKNLADENTYMLVEKKIKYRWYHHVPKQFTVIRMNQTSHPKQIFVLN